MKGDTLGEAVTRLEIDYHIMRHKPDSKFDPGDDYHHTEDAFRYWGTLQMPPTPKGPPRPRQNPGGSRCVPEAAEPERWRPIMAMALGVVFAWGIALVVSGIVFLLYVLPPWVILALVISGAGALVGWLVYGYD